MESKQVLACTQLALEPTCTVLTLLPIQGEQTGCKLCRMGCAKSLGHAALVRLASCILPLQGPRLTRENGKRERESRAQQTRWRRRLSRVGNRQPTLPLTVAVSGRDPASLSPFSPPCRGCSSGGLLCIREPYPRSLGRAAVPEGTAWGLLPFPWRGRERRAGAHTCECTTTHIRTPGAEGVRSKPAARCHLWGRPGPARPCPARVPPSRSSGARRCAGAGAPGPTWSPGDFAAPSHTRVLPPRKMKYPEATTILKEKPREADGAVSGPPAQSVRCPAARPGCAALIPQHRRHEDLIPPDNCVSHKYTAQG